MGKRLLSAALSMVLLFSLAGCSSILDGEMSEITPYYQSADTSGSDNAMEVSTYDEFKTAVSEMVNNHIETATFRITTFDRENIEESLNDVCQELSSLDPLGSYATYYISCQITPIVSYHDVSVTIVYKKDKSDIDNISTVSTDRYLQVLLQSSITDYAPTCTFYTDLPTITADYISNIIREQYYSNPLDIIVLPDISVTSHPDPDGERIMEVSFSYNNYTSSVLSSMDDNLNEEIQNIISALPDEGDYDLISALYEQLNVSATYLTVSSSKLASTAYNVIINHSGDSEGFAMAFKALCDKLSIECQVVNGKRLGEDHYWNIITFGGSSYHIDITSENSTDIPPTFLRGDEYMRENYWWDSSTVPECLSDYIPPAEEPVTEPLS